jgi:hypothetical protein
MKWKCSIYPEHDRVLLLMLAVKDVFRNTNTTTIGKTMTTQRKLNQEKK